MKVKQSLQHFLKNVYGYVFFNSMLLVSPVYAIYMQNHGVSDFWLSVLMILSTISVMITQIPVFFSARKYGTKTVLLFGQMITPLTYLLWLMWPTYIGFAIGIMLYGAHFAIYYSVFPNIVYEEVSVRGARNKYPKIWGRIESIKTGAILLSSLGSLLMFMGYAWITAFSILSICISMIFLINMQFISGNRARTSTGHIKNSVWKLMLRTPRIMLLLGLFILFNNFTFLNDFFGPIALGIGMPLAYVGALTVIVMLSQMIGQVFAHKLSRINSFWLGGLMILVGILFGIFALMYNLWGLFVFGIGNIICAAIRIILYARLQDSVPSKYRLGMLSLLNFLDYGMYIIVCMIIGVASTNGGWRTSIIILSLAICIIGCVAALFKPKAKQIH